METVQKVDDRGRVTIPKVIREALDIDFGDLISVEVKKIELKEGKKREKAVAET